MKPTFSENGDFVCGDDILSKYNGDNRAWCQRFLSNSRSSNVTLSTLVTSYDVESKAQNQTIRASEQPQKNRRCSHTGHVHSSKCNVFVLTKGERARRQAGNWAKDTRRSQPNSLWRLAGALGFPGWQIVHAWQPHDTGTLVVLLMHQYARSEYFA